MHVTILQGIPGSGKSTFAASRRAAVVVSADDYMVDKAGRYRYDVRLLDKCHRKCKRKFVGILSGDGDTVGEVIVDNTNIKVADLAFYAEFALMFPEHTVRVLTFVCDPQTAASRCIHSVPPGKIYNMHLELQSEMLRLPRRWNPAVQFT